MLPPYKRKRSVHRQESHITLSFTSTDLQTLKCTHIHCKSKQLPLLDHVHFLANDGMRARFMEREPYSHVATKNHKQQYEISISKYQSFIEDPEIVKITLMITTYHM